MRIAFSFVYTLFRSRKLTGFCSCIREDSTSDAITHNSGAMQI